jgi:hypothetical protein
MDHHVEQISVPPAAQALSTLGRIDYADAFLVTPEPPPERTPEDWARAALEEAPASVRSMLLSGWSGLGLRLGSAPADRSVLGWEIRAGTPDFMLLGADSRLGLRGELLFRREPGAFLFCTFVRHDRRMARAVWARVEPAHLRMVRRVLEGAAASSSAA